MTLRIIFLLVILALAGCNSDKPKLVAATGKVTFKNQPLTAGSLFFHPESASGPAKISSLLQLDGSFAMKTFPHGDGVPPGKYKVTLAPELAGRIGKPLYGYPAKTPWTVDVPDGGLIDHSFEVK